MARRQAVLNPQNTFYGVKRFIGRRYSEINPDSKRVPYTIRKDENSNVKIKCPRLEKEFAPEEISAMVLRKLADEASRYLGQTVTGAVITVPAYFNDSQRQATRDAGRIAGLEVLRILNEPTAAALAYGMDRQDNQTILVFDLGGGTFDVSILDVGDGVFEVKATSGDTQLGGSDFDKKVVDWLADQFLETEKLDLRRDRQSLQRLMEAAEKAKIELSGVSVTEINLPFITATPEEGPKHLETRLTRSQFEGMCTDLISRIRGPVKQALKDAGLTPNDIDEVVLVGGATRMPMVKSLVRSLIDREPNENVNPDEVVAVGAAIQAGILTQEVRDILLLDVTPLSLGLETIGGVTKKLIPRNTTIPVRRSDIFSTSENNQTMVEVHVVQGEREMATDNKSLGRFKLMGIPPAPRGVPQVLVSLDIDANGILQVTAVDKTTGREQGITIQGASTLSEGEIQGMILEAEKFAQDDRERRERVEKRTKAEALTYQAERQLREVALDFGMQFASNYRRKIENFVQELRDALAKNDERNIDLVEADLRDALYELQQEVYQFDRKDEDEGFFSSLKRTILGDDDEYDELPYRGSNRDPWNDRDPWSSDTRSTQASQRSRSTTRDWNDRDTWDDRSRRVSRSTWDTPSDSRNGRDTWDERDGRNDTRPDRNSRDTWDDREPREIRTDRDSRNDTRPDRDGRNDTWDDRSRSTPSRSAWDDPVDARDGRDARPDRDSREIRTDRDSREIRTDRDSRDTREGRTPRTPRTTPRNDWDDSTPGSTPYDSGADRRDSRDRRPEPDVWDTPPVRDRPSSSSRPAANRSDSFRANPSRSDASRSDISRSDISRSDTPRRRPPTENPSNYGKSRGTWDDDDDEWT